MKNRFELAKSIIYEVGNYLKNYSIKNINEKKTNDFTTDADKKAEDMIISAILNNFPSDSIYAEESGKQLKESRFCWVIDPIDGTVNYFNNCPMYCISIALYEQNEVVMGLVYSVCYDELFSAKIGEGAYLNGKRIYVNEDLDINKTLAIVVPPHRHHDLLDSFFIKMKNLYSLVSDFRSVGSAALSLCFIACARCSMYYEKALQLYDVAAGALIVREAGGIVEFNKDEYGIEVIASSRRYFEELKEVVVD